MTRCPSLLSRLWRRVRGEGGSATVEFVILFPMMIGLFFSAFESGMIMTRKVMLEQALDLTVRRLRLDQIAAPSHDKIKADICGSASYIPNCLDAVMLELNPIDTTGDWAMPTEAPQCIDRSAEVNTPKALEAGGPNDVMLIRVCALIDPWFPTTGLGLHLDLDDSGAFRIFATSAFVNEPR